MCRAVDRARVRQGPRALMGPLLLGLLGSATGAGCGDDGAAGGAGGAAASRPAAARRVLATAAASDLRFVLPDLEAAFERARPEIDLVASYGSSGGFFAQLTQGAPFDLFLSADEDYPAKLHAAGVANAPFRYAVGRLALAVAKGSPLAIETRGMDALRDPSVRKIAIANPAHAPYGRAADLALTAFGADAALRAKLVLGENVAQAAQFLETGAAEIGLIAKSLASSPALRARCRFVVLPEALSPGLRQAGVITKGARRPEEAAAFAAFLTGPEGRTILAQAGFQTDP